MARTSRGFSSNYNAIIQSQPREHKAISIHTLSDRRVNGSVESIHTRPVDDSLICLLFMVRAITSAFQEAKEIDPDTGNPSEHARAAFRWLMREPPTPYRTENGSFAAMCNALGPGFDRAKILAVGTPSGSYCWKDTIGGISAIRQAWNKAKFEWYISGGPKRLAAQEALLEEIERKKPERESAQMILSIPLELPELAAV